MKLYFVTNNDFKAREAKTYLREYGILLHRVPIRIQEILHLDLNMIVRDKCLKAYRELGVPCAVEHGGLYIKALNGLPGGLSKVFWDNLEGKICDLIPPNTNREAVAKVVVGYCDGKRIELFEGKTLGKVADHARGGYKFQWDPIFIPGGQTQTFAEMGFPAKRSFSQAAKAWAKLAKKIKKIS